MWSSRQTARARSPRSSTVWMTDHRRMLIVIVAGRRPYLLISGLSDLPSVGVRITSRLDASLLTCAGARRQAQGISSEEITSTVQAR
jgi:hypothetical protein